MTLYTLAGLSLAMLVLAASPGPGVIATMASTAARGFSATLAMIAGIVFGDVIFLLLAMSGLSMVAQALGELFTLIKLCGGIYLIWLGVKIWTDGAFDNRTRPVLSHHQGPRGFLSGLLVTLANPKVILFYCGFLPTFVDLTNLHFLDIIMVVAVICTVLGTVLATYAYMTAKARRVFSGPNATRRINRAAGGAMMATGVTLLSWLRRS